jgi:type I restriction enzyme S subunit
MIEINFKSTEIGNIPNEWSVSNLKDIVIIKGRIGWKGLKKSEFGNDGVIIINGPDIEDGKVNWSNCERVPQWRYDESKEISVNVDDILLTKDGTIGKVARIKFLPEPATLASGIFLIRKKVNSTVIDHNFLYYYFKSPYFGNLVESRIEGSVIPHLYQRDIEQLMVPLPPLSEQQAIVKILSDLDEKIELNNQMNKTLEDIAQAIFKRWFIDFEFPNENGEPYKSSGGEMVESELGAIPKGWIVDILGHLLKTIESGKRPKGGIDQTLSTGIPSIGAENINGLGYYDYSRTKYISEEFFREIKEGIIRDKDVLLYKDGAQLGRKTMFGSGFPFDLCCVNEHVFILRSNEFLNQFFLYFWLDQNKVTEDIKNLNSNSAQPGLNRESLRKLKILVPEKSILGRFENTISALIEKIFLNSLESRNISLARDLLLPKLMTGKIRVPLEEQNVQ